MWLDELVRFALMLFVVLDPPGNAPLFYYFTKDMEPRARSKTIRTSIAVATGILLLFAIAGQALLSYFGITVEDFRVAGGIVLFIYAVLGLLGHSLAEEVRGEDVAVVPLAIPLLAGPGAITVVMYSRYVAGLAVTVAAIILNVIIVWALLESGEKLLRLLGRQGSTALEKIMSILLAAYAVAMVREGIAQMLSP